MKRNFLRAYSSCCTFALIYLLAPHTSTAQISRDWILNSNYEFFARLDGKRGDTLYFTDKNNEKITAAVSDLTSHDAEFVALYPHLDLEWYKMFKEIKVKESAGAENWFRFQQWGLNDALRHNSIVYRLEVPSQNKMNYFRQNAKIGDIVLLDEIKSQQVDLSKNQKPVWIMFRNRSSIEQKSDNMFETTFFGENDSYKVMFKGEHLKVFQSLNQVSPQINGTKTPWYFTIIRGRVVKEGGFYSIAAGIEP